MNKMAIQVLDELIVTANDKKSQITTRGYQKNGLIPIIDQSALDVCGYTDDLTKAYSKSLPVVIFGDHTLCVKYADFAFATGADGTQIFRPRDRDFDVKYLYYLTQQETALMGSQGYKRHFSILKERVVAFHQNNKEQKRIAAILTSVDDVIENTQAQIAKLQDLKKATMNELLTKGIGHTEFKDSELGRIPKSWDVIALADFVDEYRGGAALKPSDFSKNGFPVIPKKAIQFGGKVVLGKDRTFCSPSFAKKNPTHTINSNFVISTLRDLVPSGPSIGLIGVLDESDYFILAQGVYGFLLKSSLNALYLSYLSNTDWYRGLMRKIFVGSTQIHIRTGEFLEIGIPVPSINEQIEIASIIQSFEEEIASLSLRKNKMIDLKQSLMDVLLTGRKRVKVANND